MALGTSRSLFAAITAENKSLQETVDQLEEQKSADKDALKTMQEIVDNLTENKLRQTTRNQDLEDTVKRLEGKCKDNDAKLAQIDHLEIENESLKRQLKRVTAENDDLAREVANLEANQVGEHQQTQLLQLEQSLATTRNESNETIDRLEEEKKHLSVKLKSYRGKILEIATKFKKLKNSHRITLQVVKEYSEAIPQWQKELQQVITVINLGPKAPSTAPGLETDPLESEQTIRDLKCELESNRRVLSQLESEKLAIIDAKAKAEEEAKTLNNNLMARKQENSDLLQEMKLLNEIMKERGELISKQQTELAQMKSVKEALEGDMTKIRGVLAERERAIETLIEHTKGQNDETMSTSTISKLDENGPNKEEDFEEKYNKLKLMAVKLKKRLGEEIGKIKQLELSKCESEKSLTDVLDREKALKVELEKTKGFVKKYNLLALEMESYEKSMDIQTEKLNQKQNIIKDLEQTIAEQTGTIDSLKEQVRLIEEKSSHEATHNQSLSDQIGILSATIREMEAEKVTLKTELEEKCKEITSLEIQLQSIQKESTERVQGNEMKSEALLLERDKLQRINSELELQLKTTSRSLKEKTEEAENLERDFAHYKIRAQSILQQNQSNVNSRERELEEQLETAKKITESLEQKLQATELTADELKRSVTDLMEEKSRTITRYATTSAELDSLKSANQQLVAENRRQVDEHQNALRAQRLSIETLTNVYKRQIEELEAKIATLTTEKSLRMANIAAEDHLKRSSTDEEKIVELKLNWERQQSVDSRLALQAVPHRKVSRKQSSSSSGGLMPLEDLLNSNMDELDNNAGYVVDHMDDHLAENERRLAAKENQIKHLQMLLAEAEQDVAKVNQLNDLLKEDIRRQQRSEERDAHINNSEYLKNVIFKVIRIHHHLFEL